MPAARREERKVVSVVFVDLVGSTARAESSDPEDVRALLRIYHERARDELERFGGTVEKFIGDAVVAVFGAPVAHEDDPERAVRAALAVREAVARLNEDAPGRDLHVRVAVNTGEALVSLDASPDEGEGMVAGDVVNTAARLQAAAPIDGILVGEQVFRATDRAIVYRETAPIDAKGKRDPVMAWEAIEARSRFGVDIGGAGRAELVGRDAELAVLTSALSRSRREQSTQLVTLVGVPGIGKSRLVYELRRLVDADEQLITWRQGRSLPYGEGVSYWALGEIVKAQAGILESDTAAEAEGKLADAISLLGDDQERAWVERHLRPLLGLGGDETSGDRRGEAFAAWRRFLEALALRGPTVLVFEDIHWADDGLLDFVDSLVDWVDGVPLLVVCTARPELLERRPGWGGGKRNATTVSLAPLEADETARLVLALFERSVIDAETQRELVERAAGNPLYAEEFVRMLESGGAIDGRLPETVQGIVAARIDLLPASEKELLQYAAVLGKVFWSDALSVLSHIETWKLQEALRSLERKEFIRRELRSAVAGASQHAFQHALVRDAAYGQMPRAARAARHVSAAEWIESLPDDRSEDRAATLAHHYMTAIDLFRAAGEDDPQLRTRAATALLEAGERSLLLHAFRAATHFLEQALELLDAEEPPPELLFAAGTAFGYVGRTGDELPRAVEAFERAGDPERAAEAAVMASRHEWHALGGDVDAWLERAAKLIDDRPPSRAKALVVSERARRSMLSYQPETGKRLALDAVELARGVGDVEIEAHSLVTLGCSRVALGDGEGIGDLEAALELVGGRGPVAGRAMTNLGVAYDVLGDLRMSHEVTKQGVELAEQEGDVQSAWFTRANVALIAFELGEWEEALEVLDLFADAPEGARYGQLIVRSSRVLILDAREGPAKAIEEAREIVAVRRGLTDAQALWPVLTMQARLALRLGWAAEAESTLDELVQSLRGHESAGDTQEWHVALTLALLEAGRVHEAAEIVARLRPGPWHDACEAVVEREFARAADILDATGEQPLQAELRLRAARLLVSEGRQLEAAEQLEKARAFWTSVGATSYLREADELFAAAS
jgi:class 3 adenylate cyclase/tetratricopeptide (TPR) repeat protein